MKTCTLGFLFRNGKAILAKKKRKLGIDKYNGYGGGVEEGEDRLMCLAREIREECGVVVEAGKCKELGCVDMYFTDNDELNQKVYIYRIDEFIGEPQETEEMGKPEEFDIDKIPYNEMLVGDDEFFPLVIEGKKFTGEIHLSEKNQKLTKCVIVEVKHEINNEMRRK